MKLRNHFHSKLRQTLGNNTHILKKYYYVCTVFEAQGFFMSTFYIKKTRGPWTATPALIKVKGIDQINSHFYM